LIAERTLLRCRYAGYDSAVGCSVNQEKQLCRASLLSK
jgi:hypothetical protein